MVHGENRIPYWIDRRLTGLAGPEYHAIISLGLPIEPEDSQYGESWMNDTEDVQYVVIEGVELEFTDMVWLVIKLTLAIVIACIAVVLPAYFVFFFLLQVVLGGTLPF